MGWSLSWVAVRGVHAGEVWRRLGLRPTGKTFDAPTATFSAATAEGEWAVVCANRDDRFVDGALLGHLSELGEVVGCFVEEHVMFSQTVCWKAGARAWVVTHDADRAVDHLQATGEIPSDFQALQDQARAARRLDPEGPDLVFDVPVDLAKAVVGFRHDEEDGRVFHELEPIATVRARSEPVPPPSALEASLSGRVRRWFLGR
jgi:hypothetical protein